MVSSDGKPGTLLRGELSRPGDKCNRTEPRKSERVRSQEVMERGVSTVLFPNVAFGHDLRKGKRRLAGGAPRFTGPSLA